MNKLAKFARKPAVKKVFGIFMCIMMMFTMALPSFATEGEITTKNYADEAAAGMQSVLDQVTATLSIGSILKFVAVAVGIAIGFFLFWWGTRKVIKIVRKAFASGKVSV